MLTSSHLSVILVTDGRKQPFLFTIVAFETKLVFRRIKSAVRDEYRASSRPNDPGLGHLAACGGSIAGAIFLLIELYTPLAGMIRISDAPLQSALAMLGK